MTEEVYKKAFKALVNYCKVNNIDGDDPVYYAECVLYKGNDSSKEAYMLIRDSFGSFGSGEY